MSVARLVKAVDMLMALRQAAKRFSQGREPAAADVAPSPPDRGLAGQIETRLTNVVVAALKEAFDRDHARLELERAHLEEERRRADAALRAELRRQAVERELGALRLIAAGAMLGWVVSIVLLAAGLIADGWASRAVLVAAWSLLLSALGVAMVGQRRLAARRADEGGAGPETAGRAAPGLLIAGLALTGVSLLV